MINKNDEKLHEFKNVRDWTESFNVNFISKKNKVYGSVDIIFLFAQKKVKIDWVIVYNNKLFRDTSVTGFDNKINLKRIKNNLFDYNIITPSQKFSLSFKNKELTANLNIAGVCPVYDFPDNIIDEESETAASKNSWEKYEQRCKITGDLKFKTGEFKGKTVKFDSFGQREHLWGVKSTKKVASESRIIVQFRDMSMNLSFVERDAIIESNGFISKRSGNIPIVSVECESLATEKKEEVLVSTEFSFKDAQDDVDLLVGKALYSIPMEVTNKKKKFYRFINFTEFTIIGTNKKGYGVEEHYFSKEILNSFKNPD